MALSPQLNEEQSVTRTIFQINTFQVFDSSVPPYLGFSTSQFYSFHSAPDLLSCNLPVFFIPQFRITAYTLRLETLSI